MNLPPLGDFRYCVGGACRLTTWVEDGVFHASIQVCAEHFREFLKADPLTYDPLQGTLPFSASVGERHASHEEGKTGLGEADSAGH